MSMNPLLLGRREGGACVYRYARVHVVYMRQGSRRLMGRKKVVMGGWRDVCLSGIVG